MGGREEGRKKWKKKKRKEGKEEKRKGGKEMGRKGGRRKEREEGTAGRRETEAGRQWERRDRACYLQVWDADSKTRLTKKVKVCI